MGADTQINPIILFDGVCNLCNSTVKRVIKADKKGIFRFASLQSTAAQDILSSLPVQTPRQFPDSIVLIDDNKSFTKSKAVFMISSKLNGIWRILSLFSFLPIPLTDYLYDWVASHRYKWFGRQDSCMVPTEDLKERFLDNSAPS